MFFLGVHYDKTKGQTAHIPVHSCKNSKKLSKHKAKVHKTVPAPTNSTTTGHGTTEKLSVRFQ